jgi:dethiobiotin synthetase
MWRIVVLGTGTAVGKSYVAQRLIAALVERTTDDVIGIKPVETGIAPRPASLQSAPPARSDARALELVSRGTPIRPHPIRAFPQPISPHLAARLAREHLNIADLATTVTLHGTALRGWQVIETAGGAFSPLNATDCSIDLARALDPSIWVVVAPDALGVLHDVRAALLAMRALGREPDFLVLSAARRPDASVGTNAIELPRVGLPKPVAVLRRGDDGRKALAPLVRKLLAAHRRRR